MSFDLYESVDDGVTWSKKNTFDGYYPVYLVSFTGRHFIFYLLEDYTNPEFFLLCYLYSDDLGKSWTSGSSAIDVFLIDQQIGVDQTYTGKIIVSYQKFNSINNTIDTLLATSVDDGITWSISTL